MMLRQKRVRTFGFFCAVASFGVLFAPHSHAALPLLVTGSETMDGIREYATVTVKQGGALRVKPIGSGTGFLHLRANKIVIEAGSVIDASGAGYAGVDGADGGALSGTDAGGKKGAMLGAPGTGGANAGQGGRGTNGNCSAIQATPGGTAYPTPSLLQFGAAGGASQPLDVMLASRGGHGGGRITLEAAVVHIAGLVTARGTDGINAGQIGSGGGAGGSIEIRAGTLTGDGVISVRGGYGGEGIASGGGGGGGVIKIDTPSTVPMTLKLELEGGLSGSCQNAGKGGQGDLINETTFPACPDLDMDSFTSAACGGPDCDDSDDQIHPPAAGETVRERCDGQDNDCNGMVDDNLPDGACPSGHSCRNGACEADPVTDAGVPPGPPPDHIEYQGGCAVGTSRPAISAAVLLWMLGAAGLARRTKRARARRGAP